MSIPTRSTRLIGTASCRSPSGAASRPSHGKLPFDDPRRHIMNTDVTTPAASNDGKSPLANAATAGSLRPLVDIFETRDGITLQADMPGVSRESLNLRVDGTNLLVEGTIGIAPEQ